MRNYKCVFSSYLFLWVIEIHLKMSLIPVQFGYFFQYPSHTTFIIPTSDFILSFISISRQNPEMYKRLYYKVNVQLSMFTGGMWFYECWEELHGWFGYWSPLVFPGLYFICKFLRISWTFLLEWSKPLFVWSSPECWAEISPVIMKECIWKCKI